MGQDFLIVRVRTGFNARRIRHHGRWSSGQRTGRQWRASRGARERENNKTKREQTTNAQTCDIMDDMQMEWMRTLRHLEPQCGVCTRWKVFEKNSRVRCLCRPTFHPILIVAILLTYLPLLVERLFQRCHLSRIDEVLKFGDSMIDLHMIFKFQRVVGVNDFWFVWRLEELSRSSESRLSSLFWFFRGAIPSLRSNAGHEDERRPWRRTCPFCILLSWSTVGSWPLDPHMGISVVFAKFSQW